MTKTWWIERALKWKDRALDWKEKYLNMRESRDMWRKKSKGWESEYYDCLPKDTLEEDEEDPDPTPDKKLTVANGKILYGGNPIKLCGVSRWEALWRATGAFGYENTWGKYSLEWYENQLIKSGINYVRHAGIKDTGFLYNHCKRMKAAGIIVEVTVFRAKKNTKGILVKLVDMSKLAKLGNVFFDINNEFMDGDPDTIATAITIAKYLRRQGCIVSGGAWAASEGKRQADIFHSRYNGCDILSHHRNWGETSFRFDVRKGKPVLFNEYFAMRAGLSLTKTKNLMKLAFDCGIQGITYYGFRFKGIPGLKKYDPFDYRDMLKYAGEMAKKLNA